MIGHPRILLLAICALAWVGAEMNNTSKVSQMLHPRLPPRLLPQCQNHGSRTRPAASALIACDTSSSDKSQSGVTARVTHLQEPPQQQIDARLLVGRTHNMRPCSFKV